MKKIFIAVSVVLTAVLTHAACNMANAGEYIVGLYKLTILPNDPSYFSKVPRLFDNPTTDWYDAKKHKPLEGKTFTNDISVNFKLTLQMNDPKKGYEDVRHNAKDTTFTVSIIEGSNSYIRNVRTSSTSLLFRYINNCQEATRTQRTGMPPQIKPILIALEPGIKKVKLYVKTTVDGVTLETSEIIDVFVPNYIFTVFTKSGTQDESGTYEIEKTTPTSKIMQVGHAAWKVEVYPNQVQDFANASGSANHIWGSGPISSVTLTSSLRSFMDAHRNEARPQLNVSVLGKLYKDGDQGAETFRYAFDDTRDSNNNVTRSAKDKTQAVLILTNNEATNPNYQYQIPNLNCVDQLLLAMKAGDLPKPDSTIDCRRKYEFKYKYRRQSGSFNTVYFRFQLSIPKYLIKELKKDKNIKDVLVHF